MISGTPGIDSASGEIVGNSVYEQTQQIIKNFSIWLESCDCSLKDVMHVSVFLKNVDDFAEMNLAYSEGFGDHLPARTVICINDLPKKDALLTMNLTAFHNASKDR